MKEMLSQEGQGREKITSVEGLEVGQTVVLLEDYKIPSSALHVEETIPAGTECTILSCEKGNLKYLGFDLKLELPAGMRRKSGNDFSVNLSNNGNGKIGVRLSEVSLGLVEGVFN